MILDFDLSILRWIQENMRSEIMDKIMPFITSLGEFGLIWIILTAALLIIPKTRKCGITMAIALVSGLLIGEVAMKNIIGRVRPCNLPDMNWGEFLITPPTSFSFPSGHTCSSFAAAFSLFLYHKKWGIPALILAALIAFSRSYLLVHYPTDIIAGMLLGITMAVMSFFIVKKMFAKKDSISADK